VQSPPFNVFTESPSPYNFHAKSSFKLWNGIVQVSLLNLGCLHPVLRVRSDDVGFNPSTQRDLVYIDEMHGDLNINRFILLALIFVLSIIFFIIRPNIIRILLG
jgi:hypothetical protein